MSTALRKRYRRPADAFNECPQCDSPNLMKFEGEAICGYCGWDSIALRVEARFASLMAHGPGTVEEIGAREDVAAAHAQDLIYDRPFRNQQPSVA